MYRLLNEYLSDKSVLILGFGREGRSSYSYIRKFFPGKKLGIADKNNITVGDPNVQLHCGEDYIDCINDYDLVLKSPGIPFVGVDVSPNTEITCQVDLFLRFIPCQKIGITGTKGKTTTSSLIYEIVRAAGIPACLIGNIGVPVFDSIADIDGKTAVIELSSHQLEFTRRSPHIAVLTNVYEEHLDHYDGFAGYVNAKLNIVKNQTEKDYFICNADTDLGAFCDVQAIKSKIIKVSADESDPFLRSLIGINDRLKGRHNGHNVFFAATVARCMGIEDKYIRQGIEDFKGIKHRMEPVGTFRNITFYNDCIATIPKAVISAVEALQNVDTLIFGGLDRGIDYSDFVNDLCGCNVKNLICLPDTGHRIGKAVSEMDCGKNVVIVENMEEAVKSAYELTAPGSICLLSPAAASYNRYRDFEEKGEHFISLVKQLGGASAAEV